MMSSKLQNRSAVCLLYHSQLHFLSQLFVYISVFYQPDGEAYLEEANFIRSKRNAPRLLDRHGFQYRINAKSTVSARIFWICCLSRSELKCNARAVTIDNKVTKYSGEHNHSFEMCDDY